MWNLLCMNPRRRGLTPLPTHTHTHTHMYVRRCVRIVSGNAHRATRAISKFDVRLARMHIENVEGTLRARNDNCRIAVISALPSSSSSS